MISLMNWMSRRIISTAVAVTTPLTAIRGFAMMPMEYLQGIGAMSVIIVTDTPIGVTAMSIGSMVKGLRMTIE